MLIQLNNSPTWCEETTEILSLLTFHVPSNDWIKKHEIAFEMDINSELKGWKKIHFPPFSVLQITKSIYEIFWSMITREGLNLSMMILCCSQHRSSLTEGKTNTKTSCWEPSKSNLQKLESKQLQFFLCQWFSGLIWIPKQTQWMLFLLTLSAYSPFPFKWKQINHVLQSRRRRIEDGTVLNWTINTHKSACDSFKNP